jgi:hypothetical protein
VRCTGEVAADAMVFCEAGWQTRHWRRERLKGDVQFEAMLEKGKSESCLGEISRLFRVAISKGWLPAVRGVRGPIRVVVLVRIKVRRDGREQRVVAAVLECGMWTLRRGRARAHTPADERGRRDGASRVVLKKAAFWEGTRRVERWHRCW